MAIYLGDTIINKKLLGVNKLNKIMLGTLEIFPNLIAAPTITISGEWPTDAKVGVPITPVQLTASGGTPPYGFTELGSPIQGVHLSSSGLLSGTPITAGAYSETVTVTDSYGYTGQRTYSGTVAPADVIITIDGDFPAMTVGVPITPFSFTATGGTGPYTFTVFEGVMPAGLTLASSGLVSGTPSESGPYSVTIDATDSLANNGYEVFTGDVAIDPSIWLPSDLFVNDENGGWWDLQDLGHDGNMTLGLEVNPSPEFDSSAGWVVGSNNGITGGQFVAYNGWSAGQSSYANALVVGKVYFVEFEVVDFIGIGSFQVRMGNAPSVDGVITVAGNGVYRAVLSARDTGAGARLAIECTSAAGFSMAMTYLHVKEVLSGYNPVMFQDSNTTFPVTAIEQPVGLVLDKRFPFGPQLIQNQDFASGYSWWVALANTDVAVQPNGALRITCNTDGVAGIETPAIVNALGECFLLTFDIVGRSATNVGVYSTGNFAQNGNYAGDPGSARHNATMGRNSVIAKPATPLNGDATDYIDLELRISQNSNNPTAGTWVEIDNISYRSMGANYMMHSTAAMRPAWSARKNLLRDTRQYFYTSGTNGWFKTGATITLNTAVDPNGHPLSLLAEDTSTGLHQLRYENGGDFVPAGQPRTASIVAKPSGRTKFYFGTYTDPSFMVLVDLEAKTITDGGGYYTNESITELVDGSFEIKVTSASWGLPGIILSNGTSASYAGDGVSGILFGEFQINAGTKATKYQPINTPTDYDYADYPKYAKTDGVDDRFYAPNLVYYAAFTSVQAQAYGAFDATLDLPVFGSTTPGNGFMTGRRPDKARFKYEVGPAEFQEVVSAINIGEFEVLTQGFGSGSRFYRVNDGTIESVVDNFNSGFNSTYLISVAYNAFADYKSFANMSWTGGVYISRELTPQELDNTYDYLAGNPISPPVSGFDPASLFTNGEQGAWYDFSDIAAMFQDSAGTIPVTDVEQPVGRVLDKSGRGNHLVQATAAKRPLFTAKKNNLTASLWSDFSAADGANTALQAAAPDGTMTAARLTENGANGQHMYGGGSNNGSGLGNESYSVVAKADERSWIRLSHSDTSAWASCDFDILNGVVGTEVQSTGSIAPHPDGNGWWICTLTRNRAAAGGGGTGVSLLAGDNINTYQGVDGSGVYVAWPQSEGGAARTEYQEVRSLTDYDTDGFVHWLRTDGVSNTVATAAPIDMAVTDKLGLFIGINPLVNTNTLISELGVSYTTQGGFYLARGSSVVEYAGRGARVGVGDDATRFTCGAGETSVGTALHDLNNGLPSTIRENGALAASSSSTDFGGGMFSATTLHIGSRAGTSAYFGGKISQYVLLGRTPTAQEVTDTEQFIADKTGVTLP